MALVADYRGIEDYEALFVDNPERGGKVLGPVWEGVVMYGMVVGLGEITRKNVDEWWYRLKCLEKLHGKTFTTLCQECEGGVRDGKLCPHCDRGAIRFDFGYADVVRMIGLKLNVVSITRAKFLKNCQAVLAREAERMADHGKRQWDKDQAEAERLGQPPELWLHPLNQEARREHENAALLAGQAK